MPEEKKKILVASDDATWADSVSKALNSKGITYDTAESGIEAEEMLKRGIYRVALLDLYMRMKPAKDVLRELHTDNILTPILVFAPNMNEDERKAILLEGADGFYIKPKTDPEKIPDMIERYLKPKNE